MSPIVVTNSSPAGRVKRVRASIGATPFFADNLEGGQLNPANGFTWGSLAYTPGIQAAKSVSSDYGVNSGTHAIKIVYGPDAADTNGFQGSGDIVYELGRDLSEVWIEWWFRPPSNYVHRKNATLSNNNKFFGIWRDTINNMNGWRSVLETWNTTGADATASTLRCQASSSVGNLADQTGGAYPAIINGTGDAALGVFTRMRYHLKAATAALANNGEVQFWAGDTLLYNVTNGDFWNQNGTYGDVKLNMGYFMGASNSGFNEETAFYLADFKFYDTNPGWG